MIEEIRVVAIAEANPGQEDAVAAAIRACVGPTRREAGCRFYVAHTDLDRPNHFVFVERWANRAALDAHANSPHFLAMAASFRDLLAAPLQVLVLQEL
jgi:quinol monooxygenase YgiN